MTEHHSPIDESNPLYEHLVRHPVDVCLRELYPILLNIQFHPEKDHAWALASSLIKIAAGRDNSEHSTVFFREDRPRVREIGQELHDRGGMLFMQFAWWMVRLAYFRASWRGHLEMVWDGIGDWNA